MLSTICFVKQRILRHLLTHWPLGDSRTKVYISNDKPSIVIDGWDIYCEIVFRWLPLHLIDYEPVSVHVMTWCRRAWRHNLSQCWPSSMLPYCVTRSQWIITVYTIQWHGWIITFIAVCGMQLLLQAHYYRAKSMLKFGHGIVIIFHGLMRMLLLIHTPDVPLANHSQ